MIEAENNEVDEYPGPAIDDAGSRYLARKIGAKRLAETLGAKGLVDAIGPQQVLAEFGVDEFVAKLPPDLRERLRRSFEKPQP